MGTLRQKRDAESKRSVFWGCGYSFLVTQWLSNGSFGSSWLPDFSNLGLVATVGQIAIYFSYFIFLVFIGVRKSGLIHPLHQKTLLLIFGIGSIMLGDLLAFLSGSGYLLPVLYILGTSLVGVGMMVMMLGWGEYYCQIGARTTCIVLALCFIVGSSLFSVLEFISNFSLMFAIILQLALLPLSVLMLREGWKCQDELLDELLEVPPFACKPLFPYLTVVIVLGFVLGIIIGLNSSYESASPSIVWTIGMSGIGLLVLFVALVNKQFSLDNLSRTLTPLLVICALLIPVLLQSSLELVCIFGCAGYIFARTFYTVAYASIAQTRKVAIVPLVAAAIAADSLGIIIGELLCATVIPSKEISIDVVYLIDITAVGLIVLVGSFFLREKSILSLWGLKPSSFSDEAIEKICLGIAVEQSLTLREAEVLVFLARGIETEQIVQNLEITVNTLRTHIRNIYCKLDVHSQPELIRKVVFSDSLDTSR